MRMIILAFTHTLLVPFVLRVILVFVFRRVLVLKNWRRYSLQGASTDTHTRRYSQNSDTVLEIHSHKDSSLRV